MARKMSRGRNLLLISVSGVGLAAPALAQQQSQPEANVSPAASTHAAPVSTVSGGGGIQEIVVTAQKRSQAVNSVGMSISAVTGDKLTQRGVQNVADLAKIVPGFVYTPSTTLSPVYTIRGIGFYDSSLASSPAVSIYLDEVPIPYPIMSEGVSLDLQRVEVLKGPQGTLFGEDSTGGAVNYIAAKPTSTFKAGGDLTYERFGLVDLNSYVSGPLAPNLEARLAFGTSQGGAWQKSITRDDRLGDRNFNSARFIMDWTPSDRVKFELNLNGFIDKSDTQAGQLIAIHPSNPAGAKPDIFEQPLAPHDDRAADWSPEWPNRNNNREGQASLRSEYKITDTITATSLTSFADMRVNSYFDQDGTPLADDNYHDYGFIRSFNEEFRVAQNTAKINWVLGANYSHSTTSDTEVYGLSDSSIIQPFADLPPFLDSAGSSQQKIKNYAFFANGQYNLTHNLSIQGGVRYTNSLRNGNECAFTTIPDNGLGQIIERIQELVGKTNPILVPVGKCTSLDASFTPTVEPYAVRLHESNVSWRAAVNYKFDQGLLLYANVSRGYKAGTIPTIGGTSVTQYEPAKQESVLAYEGGFKAPLFEHHVQFNGAGFYYDYSNKQTRGNILDPVFGLNDHIENVPKSYVWGLEGDLVVQPMRGLSITGGLTYLKSRVTSSFITYNLELQTADFKGSQLPFTPHVQGNADVQYDWRLRNGMKPFVGASLTYQGSSHSTFSVPGAEAVDYNIRKYALLDLRIGIAADDDRWRLTVFGRNVTNKYYWSGTDYSSDDVVREAGRPATYGITLSVKTS